MANQAVVEDLSRTRARAMQDRVETTQSERSEKRQWRIPELAVGLALMLGGAFQRAIASDSFSITEHSQKLVSLLNKLTDSLVVDKSVELAR